MALPSHLRAELLRRARSGGEAPYLSALFPAQRAFVDDPSKKKIALCSRRAGKTEGVAAWLLQGSEDSPSGLSVYIALTRNNARLILWNTLQRINSRHQLGLWFREIDGQLMVQCPNKHMIWLAGCKDFSEVDKFRGPFYRRAAIDEGKSYGSFLSELVYDALEPGLLDLNGELALVGTPGAVLAGVFYQASTGDGIAQWSTHHWTVLDNPYIPHAAQWLDAKRIENRWDESHPTYQREWLGRWVRDDTAIVYPYDGAKNACYELPEGQWSYGMGIDLGYEDSTAFVVAAYRRGHPEIYVTHVEKRQHLIPSAVAAHVERLRKEYNVSEIVVDSGGLGKGYVEEMRQSYGLPVEAAEKQHKRAYIELVRGDLLSGVIKIHPQNCRALVDEIQILQWNEDRSEPDDSFEDHAADAFLYLCRKLRPWYRPEKEPPSPGTAEWYDAERLKNREAAKRRATQAQKMRRRWS